MSRLQFIAPLVLAPLLIAGLWLWRDQGDLIWLSGFIGACF